MALVIRNAPDVYAILVRPLRGGTYARVDALVQALGGIPGGSALVLLQSGIAAQRGAPITSPGPSVLEQVSSGRYRVRLREGADAYPLVELVTGALVDGTVLDHWLVEVSPDGGWLTLYDPSTHPDPEPHVHTGDYPMRDAHLVRPVRAGIKRTTVRRAKAAPSSPAEPSKPRPGTRTRPAA